MTRRLEVRIKPALPCSAGKGAQERLQQVLTLISLALPGVSSR